MKASLVPEDNFKKGEQKELSKKLHAFYSNVRDYDAFNSVSDQSNCWSTILFEIINKINQNQTVRILEVGAGRSGFGDFLTQHQVRDNVYWVTQDVTNQNKPWLNEKSNEVYIGNIEDFKNDKKFDIVFSTFVFEHVTNPSIHLNTLNSLVQRGGSIFIFCPRYDFPGYLCPSCKHLPFYKQVFFFVKCLFYRLKTLITKHPSFLIQTDLAAFYKPFFRDSDAVHWVSLLDLKFWALNHSNKITKLKIGNPIFFTKDWIVKNLLICAIQIHKQ